MLSDKDARYSLSSSLTTKDKKLLKEKSSLVLFVSYVNIPVDIKAETDVCSTSLNVVKIVKSLVVGKLEVTNTKIFELSNTWIKLRK